MPFCSSNHCATFYALLFSISISFSCYKRFCESFFERSKNRQKCCFFRTFTMITRKLDRNLKIESVIFERNNRGTEWHQNFYSSSKIVGGDTKIVGQNATFQESHKTKPIPIVFAILKDFNHHFEGVLVTLEL